MNKTMIRFYTIADYEEEEEWLRNEHKNGWKLAKMTPPCFYVFESCEPEDVIYRLDFNKAGLTDEYRQMMKDFGWEYFAQCFGWLYFRKPAAEAASEEEGELFSDNASRVDRIDLIIKTRLLPLAVIFLCCVIPNFTRVLSGDYAGGAETVLAILFSLLFVIYVYLILHCGLKLKKLRKKYQN